MKHLVIALALILPLSVAVAAEIAVKTGIIYGHQHAFSLTAPKGWVLDNQNRGAASAGLHAVFYPEGGSWEKSPVVMYGNGFDKQKGETFEQFIAGDIEEFKARAHPEVKEIDAVSLPGNTIKTMQFSYGNIAELVTYIDAPKSVSIVVVDAREKDKLDDAMSAYKELVKSYQFVTTDVEIE